MTVPSSLRRGACESGNAVESTISRTVSICLLAVTTRIQIIASAQIHALKFELFTDQNRRSHRIQLVVETKVGEPCRSTFTEADDFQFQYPALLKALDVPADRFTDSTQVLPNLLV